VTRMLVEVVAVVAFTDRWSQLCYVFHRRSRLQLSRGVGL